jgi:hypothetical protein
MSPPSDGTCRSSIKAMAPPWLKPPTTIRFIGIPFLTSCSTSSFIYLHVEGIIINVIKTSVRVQQTVPLPDSRFSFLNSNFICYSTLVSKIFPHREGARKGGVLCTCIKAISVLGRIYPRSQLRYVVPTRHAHPHIDRDRPLQKSLSIYVARSL